MKKILLLLLLTIGLLNATEYRLTNLKKGTKLNVRELPVVNASTFIGTLPSYAIGIKIKECRYNKNGKEWCYISYPMGAAHLEGWVNRRFLKPMVEDPSSKVYIKNFLKNYYLADEENFLDKLKVFYHFPMQQYLWKKRVSLMQLRSQKVSFYKKWPTRNYNMTYMKILKRADKYIDIRTTVQWRFENNSEYESGKDIQKIRLVRDENEFKVLAIKTLKHTVDPKEIEAEEVLDSNVTEVVTGKQYYIKVGSFFSNPNGAYLANIAQQGFTYIVEDAEQDGDMIKRVFIGPYRTADQAMSVLEKVRSSINQNAYIQSF